MIILRHNNSYSNSRLFVETIMNTAGIKCRLVFKGKTQQVHVIIHDPELEVYLKIADMPSIFNDLIEEHIFELVDTVTAHSIGLQLKNRLNI